jgi:Ribbon-helix-helix protein, copG family
VIRPVGSLPNSRINDKALCLHLITLYDIEMRTIIDLPDEQIRALDEFCRRKKISRAEAVRQAVAHLLPKTKSNWRNHPAVGLWPGSKSKGDSVQYVRRIRKEWERK